MLDDFHLCPLRAVSLNLYLPSIAYRKPTGALLKACRPDAYREAVSLLAEPRKHISYREIARVCGIGDPNTIKAIERAEAATIQERKQLLPHQFGSGANLTPLPDRMPNAVRLGSQLSALGVLRLNCGRLSA